jgi:hypothetical protein
LEIITINEYKKAISRCKEVFEKKTQDYGTAWRILRLPSITDQIFIKAQRIRSIQEKGIQKVEDDIITEFIGIANYCIIAQIQIALEKEQSIEISPNVVFNQYDDAVKETMQLLEKKNHDYDEAWRDMRINSITDIILMKIFRIKQIEDNEGQTLISEGIKSNYQDILNYSVFCLIKLYVTGS